jgi:tetratricopeptide (TPR) repeat protein
MFGLMDMLNGMSSHKSSATELLFATHPMSSERYHTSVSQAESEYDRFSGRPLHRERYMDNTAKLRQIKTAVQKMQQGEAALGKKSYDPAEKLFQEALKQAPDDYAGLLLMAKCQLMQDKDAEADRYANRAKQAYPEEAQAYHISGIAKIRTKKFAAAHEDFTAYDKRLPGNPNTVFYKGLSLEGMEKIEPAAKSYYSYLQQVRQGEMAQYAVKRLKEWGYIK